MHSWRAKGKAEKRILQKLSILEGFIHLTQFYHSVCPYPSHVIDVPFSKLEECKEQCGGRQNPAN